jgi:hypothetical protein
MLKLEKENSYNNYLKNLNLTTIKKSILSDNVKIWCMIFILINIIFRATGGANPASRYATMRSMVEQSSFKINAYREWTVDWSQVGDDHYYSNKAPGPMFIGFPLFWLIEKVTKNNKREAFNKDGFRTKYVSASPRVIMSLLLQMIPFVLISFYLIKLLAIKATTFTCLALFFGNTISMLLNVYFGHGMTSIFLLLILLGFYRKNATVIGLAFGFSLLCEYTMALLLPLILILMIFQNRKDFSWFPKMLLGGLLPGLLWCWYHLETTGSVFSIPPEFQNPDFNTVKDSHGDYTNSFLPIPSLSTLYELLLGRIRGLLFLQPWLLFSLPLPFVYWKKIKEMDQGAVIYLFGFGSMIILLLMNAMFEEWHSGWMIGPRYMAAIFPVLALLVGKLYFDINDHYKKLLWVGLAVAIVFRSLVYATTILAPDVDLWAYLWPMLTGKLWIRIIVYYVLISLGYYLCREKPILIKN